LDEKGRLIIYNINAGSAKMPIPLDTAYGIMLANDGDEKKPKPRYIVAFRKARRVVDTHSLLEFKKALSKIPKGTIVSRYDSCTISRSWGLKRAQVAAYERSLRMAGLKISKWPRITCYCAIAG
jgi:hypothetical protein